MLHRKEPCKKTWCMGASLPPATPRPSPCMVMYTPQNTKERTLLHLHLDTSVPSLCPACDKITSWQTQFTLSHLPSPCCVKGTILDLISHHPATPDSTRTKQAIACLPDVQRACNTCNACRRPVYFTPLPPPPYPPAATAST
jgi:hypothetical protein